MSIITSCNKFDDSSIWEELRKHEERIEKLETFCNQINTNISSLQTIVTALQNSDYVKNVAPIIEGDKEIGYTITFSQSGSITIYHGKDGVNGADGATPQIGVKKDSDNIYYWTIDGEWLKDDSGNKIPVSGKDGDDGINGEDGVTPQLRIQDGYWQVSYDGIKWTTLDKATGNDGEDAGVVVTYDKDNVYFKFTDGSVVIIPQSKSSGDTPDSDKILENPGNGGTYNW